MSSYSNIPNKVVFCDNNTSYWDTPFDQIHCCTYTYINISNSYFIAHIHVESLKVDMYVTYEKMDGIDKFVRGFLYKDDKEYEILFYCRYVSLQIGNYGYDKIATCKLANNIF